MEKSRLIVLLKTFSLKELRELKKFVASPFFNQRKDVRKLFEIIEKSLKKNSLPPTKEDIFKMIYPEKKFSDHQIRLIMSFLLKVTETFLTYNEYFNDKIKSNIKLSEIYRKRNLTKHFEKARKEAEYQHNKSKYRNSEYFENEHDILFEQSQFDVLNKRVVDFKLQELSDNLDYAIISKKLRQVCFFNTHKTVFRKQYDSGILEILLEYVKQNELYNIPGIGVYYFYYLSLANPDNVNYFLSFKDLIIYKNDLFPSNEISSLYFLAINYCTKKYNEGDEDFLKIEFDLYKEGVEKKILFIEGVLSRFTYTNAVFFALAVKNFTWAENFIYSYKDFLEEKYKENMFNYNLARLEYERKHYKKALQFLSKANFEDILLNLAAKAIILKIFYETGEFDVLESHLIAMKTFIKRKKVIGYQREIYLNTINFTKKLIEVNPYDKEAIKALKKKIEESNAFAQKTWLLEKVDEML